MAYTTKIGVARLNEMKKDLQSSIFLWVLMHGTNSLKLLTVFLYEVKHCTVSHCNASVLQHPAQTQSLHLALKGILVAFETYLV